jgi:hypothetical protein
MSLSQRVVEDGATATAAGGSITFWGLTLAEANEVLQLIVGCLTAVSLIVLICVNLKKLRRP